jgi:hypothetical protein
VEAAEDEVAVEVDTGVEPTLNSYRLSRQSPPQSSAKLPPQGNLQSVASAGTAPGVRKLEQ